MSAREHVRLNLPETSIALIGLLSFFVGISLRDIFGASALLVSFGIAFLIAGTTYVAADGTDLLRYSLSFVALVAVPLVAFSGIVRYLGAAGIAVVTIGLIYSRLAN